MRSEKTLLLDGIEKQISGTTTLIFASYDKMTSNLAADFRSELRKTGGGFAVLKKRMLVKAAQKTGFVLDRAELKGHIGVVFTDTDPVQTTKCVYQFCKDNESVLNVVGGRFEGVVCSAKDVQLISQLPALPEMRAQLLGLFEAPMSQTLAVVEALLTSVVFCLDNKVAEAAEQSQT